MRRALRLGQQRRPGKRLADRLAQAAGVELEEHAGRRDGAERRARGGRHGLLVLRRPELLGVVEVADDVEEPGLGRLPGQLEALEVDAVDAVLGEAPGHLRMVEPEAVADDVHGADDVLEGVLLEHGPGLLQRLGDEVGLDAEDDADVVLVLARESLDERDVAVQLVQAHRPVVGEVVARLPAAEERQVVGEPHLRHPQLDRALHVLARLALRVAAQTSVDVVVGDHGGPAAPAVVRTDAGKLTPGAGRLRRGAGRAGAAGRTAARAPCRRRSRRGGRRTRRRPLPSRRTAARRRPAARTR